jgi:hypothetical protein
MATEDIAPWIKVIQVATEPAPHAMVGVSPTAPQLITSTAVPSFLSAPPGLSAAQHSFPFAVGPPINEVTDTSHAEDTLVSGDAAVRCWFVSRFAAAQWSEDLKRSMCAGNPVSLKTARFPKPRSTPRGDQAEFRFVHGFIDSSRSSEPRESTIHPPAAPGLNPPAAPFLVARFNRLVASALDSVPPSPASIQITC